MGQLSRFAASAVGAVALLAGSPAFATSYWLTFTGTAQIIPNTYNISAASRSPLRCDTPTTRPSAPSLGVSDKLYRDGLSSPMFATLTINGVTEGFFGSQYSEADAETGYVGDLVADYTTSSFGFVRNAVQISADAVGPGPSLDDTFPLTSAISFFFFLLLLVVVVVVVCHWRISHAHHGPTQPRARTLNLGHDAARLRGPWLRGVSAGEGVARNAGGLAPLTVGAFLLEASEGNRTLVRGLAWGAVVSPILSLKVSKLKLP